MTGDHIPGENPAGESRSSPPGLHHPNPSPIHGGIMEVPRWAANERYCLNLNNRWVLRSETMPDLIKEFGGCMLIGTGQMVPHPKETIGR